MQIPNRYFYFWTGNKYFLFPYVLSVKSVLYLESPEKIVVYYSKPIPDGGSSKASWDYLHRLPVEFREFDLNEFVFDFLSEEFYDRFSNLLNKREGYYKYYFSDIARYMILYKYGGIYTDFDTLTIRSIKKVIDDCNAFIPTAVCDVCLVDGQSCKFTNGNLGCISQHDFFKQCLLCCQSELLKEKYVDFPAAFGPSIIYKARQKCNDIKEMDYKVFHIIGHKGKARAKAGFFYRDFYTKICDIDEKSCVLHYHTGKKQSRKYAVPYKTPRQILDDMHKNSFAFNCAQSIDEEMLNYSWEW